MREVITVKVEDLFTELKRGETEDLKVVFGDGDNGYPYLKVIIPISALVLIRAIPYEFAARFEKNIKSQLTETQTTTTPAPVLATTKKIK